MPGPTDEQQALLDALRERDPDTTFEWDDVRGVAAFVRSQFTTDAKDLRPEGLLDVLREYAPLFGIADPAQDVRFLHEKRDDLGWNHVEYQQVVSRAARAKADRSIDVYGSKLTIHVTDAGVVYMVQSSCWPRVDVAEAPRVTSKDVQAMLALRLEAEGRLREPVEQEPINADGVVLDKKEIERIRKERAEREAQDSADFPMTGPPRLVVLPVAGGFRLAHTGYARGVFRDEPPGPRDDRPGKQADGKPRVDLGQFFVDAVTGEILHFTPLGMNAENATAGSGSAVTPLGASPATRALNVTRIDATSEYRLHDLTRTREIFTYDLANSTTLQTDTQRGSALTGGTMPVSIDNDGDHAWTTLPTNTTSAQRTAGQQPETDLQYFMADIYDWYLALGRTGWDDDQFADPPVPDQTIRALAHTNDGGTTNSINAGMRRTTSGGKWLYWLQFFDGNVTTYDYLAGSRFIVAHEYQHAVTEFSFRDGSGNPGLMYTDWLAAVHEGLSDVFGVLMSEEWLPGKNISPNGQIFRNIVFPRDDGPPPASAAYDANKFDHFADATAVSGVGFRYTRGTLLAHCAYLTGRGGVHQRSSRTPALIPVQNIGRQTVGGRSVLRAARIWYRALNVYVSTVAASTGSPTDDANIFRGIRTACVNAAIDLYGSGSREHRTTVLAWYAVGLQPTATTYGADPTFLTWGADWELSIPYVGLNSPLWASLDLFINNGGTSEWNAVVNVLDGMGNPTDFENDVYCRVRNVGDQAASGVTVQFHYAKIGTAPTGWIPVTDKNGVAQTLTIGPLGAGQNTFLDTQQNTPPASAGVKWWIPPIAAGETVDHYCLRATVSSTNDANDQNNVVQSNISYVAFAGATGIAFTVGNPSRKPARAELVVTHSLPKGWEVSIEGLPDRLLKPDEAPTVHLRVTPRPGGHRSIEAPFDGSVTGKLSGQLSGRASGTLSDVNVVGDEIEGRISLLLEDLGTYTGSFKGTIDLVTARLRGVVTTPTECGDGGCLRALFIGRLRPNRRVDVTQMLGGERIGGITVQVQVPLPGKKRRAPIVYADELRKRKS